MRDVQSVCLSGHLFALATQWESTLSSEEVSQSDFVKPIILYLASKRAR